MVLMIEVEKTKIIASNNRFTFFMIKPLKTSRTEGFSYRYITPIVGRIKIWIVHTLLDFLGAHYTNILRSIIRPIKI